MKTESISIVTSHPVLSMLLCTCALVVTMPAHAAQTDAAFFQSAAEGASFEIMAADLAQKNSSSDQVKLLADKIATDHGLAIKTLKQIASIENRNMPPLSSADEDKLKQLSALHGAAFDKAYLDMMVEDHKADIATFLNESKNGKDLALKPFATRQLPDLQQHLYLSEQVRSQQGR